MARIAGVDLPPNKRVEIGLTYIYGIGRTQSARILREAGINFDTKVRELNDDEINKIRKLIEEQHEVEGDLRKDVSFNIKRLMEIGSYRGAACPCVDSAPIRMRARVRGPGAGLSPSNARPPQKPKEFEEWLSRRRRAQRRKKRGSYPRAPLTFWLPLTIPSSQSRILKETLFAGRAPAPWDSRGRARGPRLPRSRLLRQRQHVPVKLECARWKLM